MMSRKYIIEIEEVPFERQDPDAFAKEDRIVPSPSSDQLFRVVGFKSMVFTKEGLGRLVPLSEYSMEKNASIPDAGCRNIAADDLPMGRRNRN